MPPIGMSPPYWYICNFCNKEYKQTSNPKVCKACGRKDFRIVSPKHRQGAELAFPIIIEEHTEK